jgi:hypothetical protein
MNFEKTSKNGAIRKSKASMISSNIFMVQTSSSTTKNPIPITPQNFTNLQKVKL